MQPAEPGYKSIKVNPKPGYLTWAKGEVVTPKGIVNVDLQEESNGKINVKVEVPEGIKYILPEV